MSFDLKAPRARHATLCEEAEDLLLEPNAAESFEFLSTTSMGARSLAVVGLRGEVTLQETIWQTFLGRRAFLFISLTAISKTEERLSGAFIRLGVKSILEGG
jgi:hypothetical protein